MQNERRQEVIQPRDHVIIDVDGGTRVYTVQAISRAGQDVYLTHGDNTSIGIWVDIEQVTRVPDPEVVVGGEAR